MNRSFTVTDELGVDVPERSRHVGSDTARLLAVIMLVGFHAIPGAYSISSGSGWSSALAVLKMGLFAGLPILFMVSGYVGGVVSPPADSRHVWRRVARLVRLLVVWSVIYGTLALAQDPVQLQHPVAYVRWWVLGLPFGLAFGHLWFLAALAECHLADAALRRLGVGVRGRARFAVGLFAASLLVAWFVPELRTWLDRSFVSWYAFYAGGSLLISRASAFPQRLLAAATALLVVACLPLYYVIFVAGGVREIALGSSIVTAALGACTGALVAGGAGWRRAPADSRVALGVFLLHPMALALGAGTLALLVTNPPVFVATRFLLALTFAASVTWVIMRSRRLSALIL